MSWAMDGYINDFGIATMAAGLAERTGDSRYAEEAGYFRNRALSCVTSGSRAAVGGGQSLDWRLQTRPFKIARPGGTGSTCWS
jgi:hypothetical protein